MLPKERADLEREHVTPGKNVFREVRIGNRRAWLIDHYSDWQTAMVVAFYLSTEHRLRTYVIRCDTHDDWMVWETNQTCPVKTKEQVLWCRQCGNPYGYRACGPTHALQAHRLRLTGIKL